MRAVFTLGNYKIGNYKITKGGREHWLSEKGELITISTSSIVLAKLANTAYEKNVSLYQILRDAIDTNEIDIETCGGWNGIIQFLHTKLRNINPS